tara:strand:+ start:4281 stop:5333 length:1053 start_codon:yes stop_codon:yes gene_type:complete
MKRVLITGNQGFIGTWLSLYIKKVYPDVKIFGIDDRRSLGERMIDFFPSNMLGSSSSLMNDIKLENLDEITKFLTENNIDTIFHLAAQAIVPRAFEEPNLTFQSNVVATFNILEASRNSKNVEKIALITSDKVYKNDNKSELFEEGNIMSGKDIYSCSKVICEHLAHAYRSTHLKELASKIHTIRLGNVVGGGDYSVNRLIPDLIRAYLQSEIFYVRYPNATRPFQHVLDVCNGILNITLDDNHNYEGKLLEGWNLGPKNNSYAYVSEVIKSFSEYFPGLNIQQSPILYDEDIRLEISNQKYAGRYDLPLFDSKTSIDHTLKWYQSVHLNTKDPLEATLDQINLYLENQL